MLLATTVAWAALLGQAGAGAPSAAPSATPSAAPLGAERGTPRAADLVTLKVLHEKVMSAHRASDVEKLLADEAEDYVVAGRGAIARPSLADRRARLGAYLSTTRFTSYRDLVEPVVQVSADGTLGWVIVQVEGKGEQTVDGEKKPLEFVSAWIELYEKRGGRWYRVGNVSNFKP